MGTRAQTILICVIVTLGLIIWDIVMVLNNTKGDTISNVLYTASTYAAAIPYAFGCVCVHWFWPTRRELLSASTMASVLIAGAVLVTVAGWILHHPEWWGIFCLITGGAAGKLWPNSRDGEGSA